MSSLVMIGRPSTVSVTSYSDTHRDWVMSPNCAFFAQRLPTEPIGTTTVTFDGVNTGSEIRVSLSDMTELSGVESSTDNPSLTWNVYASGSANNTVRIVIIHPDYRIKEFTYTSTLGNQMIPVQQEPDKWYSNP